MAAHLGRFILRKAAAARPFFLEQLHDFGASVFEEVAVDQWKHATGVEPKTPPPSSVGGVGGMLAGKWVAAHTPKLVTAPPGGVPAAILNSVRRTVSDVVAPLYSPDDMSFAFRRMGVPPYQAPWMVRAFYFDGMAGLTPAMYRQLAAHSRDRR